MDNRFKTILQDLPPKKRQRSKLEPYAELIEQLRRRGHTYREISRILAEKCGLTAVSSTLVRFVAARAKKKQKLLKHRQILNSRGKAQESIEVNTPAAVSANDLWQRIEALKQRSPESVQPSRQFEYDPDQPLQLPRKK